MANLQSTLCIQYSILIITFSKNTINLGNHHSFFSIMVFTIIHVQHTTYKQTFKT